VACRVFGSGPATPLLVIHGIPGTSSGYLNVLAAIGADRPVIFYDQLGGGASDRPTDPSLWTLGRFVEEVAAVRAALGLTDVHILGHSWGGLLAIEHALSDDASGIRSLVLASVPVSIPEYVADIQQLRRDLPLGVRRTLEAHEHAGTTSAAEYQDAVTGFRRRHLYSGDEWAAEFIAALGDINLDVFVALWGTNPFDCAGALKDYARSDVLRFLPSIPVLFTIGAHDATTAVRAVRYSAAIAGSQVVVFEKSAHVSMLEESERYLGTVRTFLRSADAPR
jgi:proline-specific peptidase